MDNEFDTTISDAAVEHGLSPNTIRYWIKFKGLESQIVEPEWGKRTTMVRSADVKAIKEMRNG
jgi:transposase-like protein